jgi:hypothetical protein
MTDATNYGQSFVSTVKALIDAIENANVIQDRLASEPGLADATAAAMASGGIRNDLTGQMINDAANAIVQIVFAYNSGSPTQKSLLYKVL